MLIQTGNSGIKEQAYQAFMYSVNTENIRLLSQSKEGLSNIKLDSRVRNEPNASLLALGDCARVTYPAALQRCKFDTPLLAAGLLI